MKKIVCWILFLMLALMIGACSEKSKVEVDHGEQQVINNGETKGDESEENIVEVGGLEHWEKAYECMQDIGKAISEFSGDYKEWKYQGGAYALLHYEDLKTGRYYAFSSDREYDSYIPKLFGDEICSSTTIKLKDFFPKATWPTNIEETKQSLDSYLGIEFELLDARNSEGIYIYQAEVEWNSVRYGISIWTETGLLTPELNIGFARNPEEL